MNMVLYGPICLQYNYLYMYMTTDMCHADI